MDNLVMAVTETLYTYRVTIGQSGQRNWISIFDPATGELDKVSWYVTYLPTQNSPELDHKSKPILCYQIV